MYLYNLRRPQSLGTLLPVCYMPNAKKGNQVQRGKDKSFLERASADREKANGLVIYAGRKFYTDVIPSETDCALIIHGLRSISVYNIFIKPTCLATSLNQRSVPPLRCALNHNGQYYNQGNVGKSQAVLRGWSRSRVRSTGIRYAYLQNGWTIHTLQSHKHWHKWERIWCGN